MCITDPVSDEMRMVEIPKGLTKLELTKLYVKTDKTNWKKKLAVKDFHHFNNKTNESQYI